MATVHMEITRESVTAGLERHDDERRVRIASQLDIVTARKAVRELAGKLGFATCEVTVIASAVSEIARNIVEHAVLGEVTVRVVREPRRQGIVVIAADRGPGIANITRAMQDGFSTGLGLPGAKRMMDEFSIVSTVGEGTTVTMRKWVA